MASLTLATMQSWSSQIEGINENADGILDEIEQNVKDTETYWQGTSAEAYITNQLAIIAAAKKYHSNMSALSDFLIETAETRNNE